MIREFQKPICKYLQYFGTLANLTHVTARISGRIVVYVVLPTFAALSLRSGGRGAAGRLLGGAGRTDGSGTTHVLFGLLLGLLVVHSRGGRGRCRSGGRPEVHVVKVVEVGRLATTAYSSAADDVRLVTGNGAAIGGRLDDGTAAG